jgi:hypothetical protein
MRTYQRIDWALRQGLPKTHGTGKNAIGRVLVAMANDADEWTGETSISIRTLASDLSGLHRRDIQNAVQALEAEGLIRRRGMDGRRVVWVVGPTKEPNE